MKLESDSHRTEAVSIHRRRIERGGGGAGGGDGGDGDGGLSMAPLSV